MSVPPWFYWTHDQIAEEFAKHNPPCPYTGHLHPVVNTVDDCRTHIAQGVVTSKSPGNAIITTAPLLTVVDHLNIPAMDLSGKQQLHQEADKERRAALSRDGNDDMNALLPFIDKQHLKSRGLKQQPLRQAAAEAHFNITGALITVDDNLRKKQRQWLLVEGTHELLMNQELVTLLPKYFNMAAVPASKLASTLHGVYNFQTIHVIVAQRVFAEPPPERSVIAADFTTIPAFPIRNTADLLSLTTAVRSFSVMFGIMGGKPAFDSPDSTVLVQVLEHIQNLVPTLPFSIQPDVNTALADIQSLLSARIPVDVHVLNVALAPYFARISKDSSSSHALAAMSAA